MWRLIFCMVSTFVTRQSNRRKQTYMHCTMGYYMWNDWMRLSTHKSGMLDVCSEFSTRSSFYLSERQDDDQVSFPSTFPLWPPGPHCWSSQHARLTSNGHALCCPPDRGTAPDSSSIDFAPESCHLLHEALCTTPIPNSGACLSSSVSTPSSLNSSSANKLCNSLIHCIYFLHSHRCC